MAKKYFWRYLMSSENVLTQLVSGRYYEDGAPAEIHDGALVVIGDLEDHAIYANIKDLDTHKITKPTAVTDKVAIVDLVNVSEGKIQGELYREGMKTAGLTVSAGIPVRVRRLVEGDKFYLATGNFVGDVVVGEYAIPTADSTLWTPASELVKDACGIKVLMEQPLVEGAVNTDTKYFCVVEQVGTGITA